MGDHHPVLWIFDSWQDWHFRFPLVYNHDSEGHPPLIVLDQVSVQEEGIHQVLHQVGWWSWQEGDWEGVDSDEEILLSHQSYCPHTDEDPQKEVGLGSNYTLSFHDESMLRTAWTSVLISTGINWNISWKIKILFLLFSSLFFGNWIYSL